MPLVVVVYTSAFDETMPRERAAALMANSEHAVRQTIAA